MKLHHIALAVADVDTSTNWYASHLGFTEQHRYDKNGKTFCMISDGGFQLELISSEDTQDLQTKQSALPRWMRHFCIEVEDLDTTHKQFQDAGVTIEKEVTEAGFGGRYIFISDPDGNMIEVWCKNQFMNKLEKVREAVREIYEHPDARSVGLWMWENHVQWVANKAEELTNKYEADTEKVVSAALLHDLADAKYERDHEQFDGWSESEAKRILLTAGFSEEESVEIVEIIVRPHSCRPNKLPTTLEGKVLATADAMFHLRTSFFPVLCFKNMPASKQSLEEWQGWFDVKIEREYDVKIFFEDEKQEIEADYQALKRVFGNKSLKSIKQVMSDVIKTAQKYFDYSNARNLEAIEGMLHDDTTYSSPNVGVFLGKEQIMEMKKDFYGSFTEMAWDVKSVEEVKPGVVLFDFVFSGTKNDGEKVERPGLEFVIVKDERLQHIEVRNKQL